MRGDRAGHQDCGGEGGDLLLCRRQRATADKDRHGDDGDFGHMAVTSMMLTARALVVIAHPDQISRSAATIAERALSGCDSYHVHEQANTCDA